MPSASARAERLLRRLEWRVIRRLDGLLQGDYRTLMRGSGLDLADLREYQPHDDVRHIDWNVTARLQQPHVRVFSEDREMAAWFLLDVSASVRFGPAGHDKHDVLTGFVGVLARLLTRHGNRVGALLYGADAARAATGALDRSLPPRSGRAQVLQLLHRLQADAPSGPMAPASPRATALRRWFGRNATAPAPAPVPATEAGTDLAVLLRAGLATVKRRSTVFVVSDFLSRPGWEPLLARLVERHDVVAVRVLDPTEQALPNVGLLTLRDAETGELLTVDTQDTRLRQRFAALAEARDTALRERLARAGADTLELSTADDLTDALLRFMELRRRKPLPRGGGPRWPAGRPWPNAPVAQATPAVQAAPA
ncbi:DUF58 domain-containing protein [Acidovorax lacteus]|uniref:DUF58 domain-containing protein n=1 Tax=Acidovorax lacteus TaxID=1924988 RepID=A0ABP8LF37_9BURK